MYPDHELQLICRKHVGDFFVKTKLIDRVFEVKKGDAASYEEIQKTIATTTYDLFFCPHQSLRSYLFSRQVKSRKKITYKLWFNFFGFDERVVRNKSLPEPLRVMQLLLPLSEEVQKEFQQVVSRGQFYETKNKLLSETPSGFKLNILNRIESDSFSFFALKKKLDIPDKSKKWVCVFPGSVWETKKWTLEHYRILVGLLLKKDWQILLMGAPGEEKLCEFIFSHYRESENIYNFCGRTSVYESALIMSHSDLVIGNDSASSHLATVCDRRLITFFGPTVLSFGYRPWGDHVYVFQNEQLKCRPCGPHGHDKCPLGTHECMRSLKPLDVYQFIQSLG